jgi:hypothetical protein
MIGGSSSAHLVEDLSSPNISSIGGVVITRLPAGEALGAQDLQRWSSRRSAGLSKAYSTKQERQRIRNWKAPKTPKQALTLEDAAKLGILIERTPRGWLVSSPSGRTLGPFWLESGALRAVAEFAR